MFQQERNATGKFGFLGIAIQVCLLENQFTPKLKLNTPYDQSLVVQIFWNCALVCGFIG